MTRITRQRLEFYLLGAAVCLLGPVDAANFKTYIFPLLYYKRPCDVFDEETAITLQELGGYQNLKAEPGFTRVVPIEEIRTKDGDLSIPALLDVLSAWLESSRNVRKSRESLMHGTP